MFSYKIANHVFDNVLMDENAIFVTFGIKRGVRKEMNFVRLSHDRVTFDVDRDVSTAMFNVHYCLSGAHYCEDHFHSRLYPQFKYMTFIYS